MNVKEKLYVENNLLAVIKLYVESFMLEYDKGFKSNKEKEEKRDSAKKEIFKAIEEKSKLFGVSVEELLIELKTLVFEYKANEKEKQEWFFIEKLIDEWSNAKDNQEER